MLPGSGAVETLGAAAEQAAVQQASQTPVVGARERSSACSQSEAIERPAAAPGVPLGQRQYQWVPVVGDAAGRGPHGGSAADVMCVERGLNSKRPLMLAMT